LPIEQHGLLHRRHCYGINTTTLPMFSPEQGIWAIWAMFRKLSFRDVPTAAQICGMKRSSVSHVFPISPLRAKQVCQPSRNCNGSFVCAVHQTPEVAGEEGFVPPVNRIH